MEELFDNIFVLVPVALIIFLRVFSDGARKRGGKAKNPAGTATSLDPSDPSGQSVPARPEPRRSSREARPRVGTSKQAKTPERQTGPARQTGTARVGLINRLRNYFSGSLDQQAERMEPLHFEEEATRRLGQFKTQATASPGSTPQQKPVYSGYKEGLPGAMEESAAIIREPVATYAFPGRLDRLPPLKRAIVLSEVLGKPKSMQ